MVIAGLTIVFAVLAVRKFIRTARRYRAIEIQAGLLASPDEAARRQAEADLDPTGNDCPSGARA